MLQIFSNFANDIIVYENNRTIPWWPAFWITKALDSDNITYILTVGNEPAIVKIDRDSDGNDRGIIVSAPTIHYVVEKESQLLLISTLKDEFDLKLLSDVFLPVCIDIQGFLRGDGGKKKRFDCGTIQTKWNVYIKATREEFSCIDNYISSWFIFIITDEWKDIEVLKWDDKYYISIQSGEFKDTIGAGDTFFATFCSKFLETKDIKQAIQQASVFTYWFLKDKNTNYSL